MADVIVLNRANTCGWDRMKSINFWGWAYTYNGFTNSAYNALVGLYLSWQASAQENKLSGEDENGQPINLSQSPPDIHPPTR